MRTITRSNDDVFYGAHPITPEERAELQARYLNNGLKPEPPRERPEPEKARARYDMYRGGVDRQGNPIGPSVICPAPEPLPPLTAEQLIDEHDRKAARDPEVAELEHEADEAEERIAEAEARLAAAESKLGDACTSKELARARARIDAARDKLLLARNAARRARGGASKRRDQIAAELRAEAHREADEWSAYLHRKRVAHALDVDETKLSKSKRARFERVCEEMRSFKSPERANLFYRTCDEEFGIAARELWRRLEHEPEGDAR